MSFYQKLDLYPFHMDPLTRVEPGFDPGSTIARLLQSRVEPGLRGVKPG